MTEDDLATMDASKIDVHIGRRLKVARTMRNLTQSKLGQLIGVTLQQVQKYERGSNKISASRLYMLAVALDIKISDLYKGLPDYKDDSDGEHNGGLLEDSAEHDQLECADVAALLRAYYLLHPKVKKQAVKMVKVLSAGNI